jgi:hypothetical protein
MVFDDYFMLIPVYRLSEDKYMSDMESDFEKKLTWDEEFCEKNPDMLLNYKGYHHKNYGGVWEFNEIIGYIKLYFYGRQVRGEYWSTLPNRKVRSRRKQFEYKTHKLAAEVGIKQKTSEAILEAVEEYLLDCKREIKNRYIDLREFNSLKRHLNWLTFFEEKNPFEK